MPPNQNGSEATLTKPSVAAPGVASKDPSWVPKKDGVAVLPIKNAYNLEVTHATFDHPEFRQVFPTETYPPIPVLDFDDRAAYADPTLKNLLEHATVRHIAPKIGTELSGIQLHELTDAQKDELALLTAQRGVVFLVDQQITPTQQLQLGRYWGPLHVHATLGHVQGEPELFVVEATVESSEQILYAQSELVSEWHSDVTYERQPPSYTTLRAHAAPDVGADTIWASSYEAYNRLTPAFQQFVEGLTAIHSSKAQAETAIANGKTLRRLIVEFEHPVVRTHPVTKRKALFVNPLFTTRIKNLSRAESDAVLRFLNTHIVQGHEFQVRYHLAKDTVALWDNRISTHAATFDFLPGNRLATRVTTHGEIPYFDKGDADARP
jgi:sulfonate dioxygenase